MPLLAFGSNAYGQLGIRSIEDRDIPTPCAPPLDQAPRCIAGGANHTIIVTSEGQLLSAGHNERGQLGLPGGDHHEFTPIPLENNPLVRFSAVACGWDHSVALTTDCRVFVWGSNEYGQLGLGNDVKSVHEPKLLDGLDSVVRISCGMRFTVALTADGQVWGWGGSRYGELGVDQSPQSSPSLSRKAILYKPTPLPDFPICKDIACGQYHVIYLSEDNVIKGKGRNRHGQLGMPPDGTTTGSGLIRLESSSPSTQLFCGWSFSGYVDESGRVVAWGRNDHHQLGNSGSATLACPSPTCSECLQDTRLIACGSEHALAIDKFGKCVAWGWNEHGNCGVGGTEDVTIPTNVRDSGVKIVGSGYGHSFVYIESRQPD